MNPKYIQLPLDFEVWKPIPGYEGLCEVSNQGRIKCLLEASNGACKAGRILKPWPTTHGYMMIGFSFKGTSRKVFLVHRLVAMVFIGQCPPKQEVNHKNGIKQDNRVENLEYVTHRDNQLHSYRQLGRKPPNYGETHFNTKFTEDDVRTIRKELETMTVADVAKQHSVDWHTIGNIKKGKSWKQLK